MNYLILMELRRSLLQMRRYPVETILSFTILAGMFFGISYGAAATFGSVPADKLASVLLLSYLGWMLCMNLLSGSASELEAEAQQGTIEQVFTGRIPVAKVLAARMIAGTVVTLAIVGIVAAVMGAAASARLGLIECALLVLACVTAAGGGFALAGVALLLKRSRSLVLLVTFGLMPVMMSGVPASWTQGDNAILAVPFLGPIGLAKASLQGGRVPTLQEASILAAVSLTCLVAGVLTFRTLRERAMRRGTIGQY